MSAQLNAYRFELLQSIQNFLDDDDDDFCMVHLLKINWLDHFEVCAFAHRFRSLFLAHLSCCFSHLKNDKFSRHKQ